MKIEKYIRTAKSLKDVFQTGHSFHCTLAVKGGSIIAIGINNYNKPHPKNRFGDYISNRPGDDYKSGVHSEIDCLRKIQYRKDLRKITLINIRIDNNGDLAYSEPCMNCKRVLSEYKFKRIYYTIDNQKVGRLIYG